MYLIPFFQPMSLLLTFTHTNPPYPNPLILVSVYIPPQAHVSSAFQKLADTE